MSASTTASGKHTSLIFPPSPLIHAGPTLAPLEPATPAPAGRRAAPAASDDHGGFNPFTASCFTVNYIMGTGFLTLPWAFVSAGLALSAAGIVFVTFCAYISMVYILEGMARADGVTKESARQGQPVPPPSPLISSLPSSPAWMGLRTDADAAVRVGNSKNNEKLPLIGRPITGSSSSGFLGSDYGGAADALPPGSVPSSPYLPLAPMRPPIPSQSPTRAGKIAGLRRRKAEQKEKASDLLPCEVGSRKFEVTELCLMFMGKKSLASYMTVTGLYLYGALWAYTSVFANALVSALPPDWGCGYGEFVAVFALIVVPLSLMDLKEQVAVQVSLSVCRLIMVAAMVGTIYRAILTEGEEHFDPSPSSERSNPPARWGGLYVLLPVAAYAVIFHHSIPGLSQPVADRSKLSSIFGSVFVITSLSYCLIGIVVGYYFGSSCETSANINWSGYHGGTGVLVPVEGGGFQRVDVAWWARIISGYVVCFPALDVISAFPLNAITLGNNLLGAYYGEKIHKAEKCWKNRTRFRFYACIPPIMGALFVRDLGTITDYTGVTGFAIAFSFPALLFIYSRRMMEEHFPQLVTTRYSNAFSSEGWALLIFFFGVGLIVFVLGCLFWDSWGDIITTHLHHLKTS
mmetsp:Transcript_34396/g.67675  ORF Transcript_34396/g.67675 Transcript_34396/m.67675 type:complete len:631 (-) Transcript_34396:360-2252(-)